MLQLSSRTIDKIKKKTGKWISENDLPGCLLFILLQNRTTFFKTCKKKEKKKEEKKLTLRGNALYIWMA